MRTNNLFLFILVLTISSCNTKNDVKVQDVIRLDLHSSEGVQSSIETITSGDNWTQARYDSINEAIARLASAGAIDKDMYQDEKLIKTLFTSSAVCLEKRVDTEFRRKCDKYRGVSQMNSDLMFLKKYHKLYLDNTINLDENNISLTKVEDILEQYDIVLTSSRYVYTKYSQQPDEIVLFKEFPLNWEITRDRIKNNKYYNVYFSNNKEITSGLSQLEGRWNNARRQYYMDMEALIEKKIVADSLSYDETLDMQSQFHRLAKSINQEATDKLDKFIDNYGE